MSTLSARFVFCALQRLNLIPLAEIATISDSRSNVVVIECGKLRRHKSKLKFTSN